MKVEATVWSKNRLMEERIDLIEPHGLRNYTGLVVTVNDVEYHIRKAKGGLEVYADSGNINVHPDSRSSIILKGD